MGSRNSPQGRICVCGGLTDWIKRFKKEMGREREKEGKEKERRRKKPFPLKKSIAFLELSASSLSQ